MHLTREEIKALIQLLEWQSRVNQEQSEKRDYQGTPYSTALLHMTSEQIALAERFRSLLRFKEDQASFLIVRV